MPGFRKHARRCTANGCPPPVEVHAPHVSSWYGSCSLFAGPFRTSHCRKRHGSAPQVHYTMGGVEINERAEVLRQGGAGEIVRGLYAAGEASGG